MNRIRHIDGKYQVLLTPNLSVSPSSMELLLGNLEDETLRDFKVAEFNNLGDAQCLAYKYPDVDWYKIIRMNVDAYHQITNIINLYIKKNKIIADIDANLADPEQYKNAIFDRVLNMGDKFTLRYDFNDVICINISNPWSKKLQDISNLLINIPELRIHQRFIKSKVIHLIGYTDLGMLYEIKLWPSIIMQWAKWSITSSDENIIKTMFSKALQSQEVIDRGFGVNYF